MSIVGSKELHREPISLTLVYSHSQLNFVAYELDEYKVENVIIRMIKGLLKYFII